jgi:RNA polymerase sigma-70 factor, ECF subfamily
VSQPSSVPAFSSCLRAFGQEFDYVFRTLRRHGIAAADAEDLAQEVFLVMWRRWSSYDRERPLRPWLAGIAFRLAYHHRERRREDLRPEFDLPDHLPDPEAQLETERFRRLVLAALASLPERHRAPLVLCDLDGLTMPEVADILEVPLSTAYTRVRRARLAFAAEVERRRSAGDRSRPHLAISAGALLGIERPLPRTPLALRRRIQNRLLQRPGAPPPAASRPWSLRVPVELAVCASVALLATLAWVSPDSTVPALSVAHARASARPTLASGHRPASPTRARPPMFARAAVPPSLASLAEGMAGYWRFDEGKNATFARDLSGRGNDCKLHRLDAGKAWTHGVHGGAVDLRGRGWLDCRQQRSPGGAPGAITVAAWVNRARAVPHHTVLVTRELSGNDRDDYFFGFYRDDLKVSASTWDRATAGRFTVPLGSWTHVAFTRSPDGTTVLYLDGREIARQQVAARPIARGPRRLMIGGGHSSGQRKPGQDFDGALDELVVYDRTLAPAEIQTLAAGAQPPLSL